MKKVLAASLLLLASLSQGHPTKCLTSKQLVITNVTIIDADISEDAMGPD